MLPIYPTNINDWLGATVFSGHISIVNNLLQGILGGTHISRKTKLAKCRVTTAHLREVPSQGDGVIIPHGPEGLFTAAQYREKW